MFSKFQEALTAAFYKDSAHSITASSKYKIVTKFFHRLDSNYMLGLIDGKMWFGNIKTKQTNYYDDSYTNCSIGYLVIYFIVVQRATDLILIAERIIC